MPNFVVMSIYLVVNEKHPFLSKFGPKNQNCLLKINFGIETNSKMLNLIVMFTFSVSDWKYRFGPNLVQKIKVDCLR